jgi:NAD(P)H-dependent FMN reductase
MNLVIISGSPRQGSLTHRIALHLEQYFTEATGHNIQLVSVQDIAIPALQQVWTSVEKVPADLQPVAEIIFKADAFVLVSPEYNGSYSAALKNFLDHFPKQQRKPFGIVTGSPGALGGIRAGLQMQALVAALFGIASPNMLIVPLADKKFDAAGKLLDASFQNNVQHFATEFLWMAERLTIKEFETA